MSIRLLGLGRPRRDESFRYSAARDRAVEVIRRAAELDVLAAENEAARLETIRHEGTVAQIGPAQRPDRAGVVVVPKAQNGGWTLTENDLLAATLEADPEEVNDLGASFEIISNPSETVRAREANQAAGLKYESAEVAVREPHLANGISVKPLGDRILVQPLEAEQTTSFGLVIPDTAKEKPQEGRVIATGPGRVDDNGNRVPLDVATDDVVIFSKFGGAAVDKYDGQDCLLLNARDILAVVSDAATTTVQTTPATKRREQDLRGAESRTASPQDLAALPNPTPRKAALAERFGLSEREADVMESNGDVVSPDGDKIGGIGQIYLDDSTGQPAWVTSRTGLFGTSESFVPLEGASVSGDDIQVAYGKDQVRGAPRIDDDGKLSPEEEETLYNYYGVGSTSGTTVDNTVTGTTYDDNTVTGTSYDETTTGTTDGSAAQDSGADRETVGYDTSGPTTDDAMTLSEEQVNVGTKTEEAGRARLRKYVGIEQVTQTVPVSHEEVRIEREPITDGNVGAATSGPDISEEEHEVVLHAERPVVEKETLRTERVHPTETG